MLVSETAEGLQKLLDVFAEYCRAAGLRVNTAKEKSATMHIVRDGDPVHQHNFTMWHDENQQPVKLFNLKDSAYRYLGVV